MWLRVVDLTRMINQRSQLWRGFDKEPRVHADAVSANAGTRVENFYARMQTRNGNRFPHIHAEFIREAREFIGDGDVHVAVGVLHQLDHLRGGRVRFDNLSPDEGCVQVAPRLCGFRSHTADDARVLNQLAHDLPRQNALRRICEMKINTCFQSAAL